MIKKSKILIHRWSLKNSIALGRSGYSLIWKNESCEKIELTSDSFKRFRVDHQLEFLVGNFRNPTDHVISKWVHIIAVQDKEKERYFVDCRFIFSRQH